MFKIAAAASSVLVSLGLAAFLPGQPPPSGGPPPPKAKGKGEAKKKGERGPGGDLRKAYDLLRRLRADDSVAGRPEERLRDWTERAAELYRDGLKAFRVPATTCSPASTGRPPTTWPGPSTTPATPPGSTAATPTCRRPPTTSAWRTPASGPAAT